jgi:hypothetical protein
MNTVLAYSYKLFKGLNLRDDPNSLQQGKTSKAENNELVLASGLSNKSGINNPYDVSYASKYWDGWFRYENKSEEVFYVAVSYPNVYLVDANTGFPTLIYSSWFSSGKPFFIPSRFGTGMLVDGANTPLEINNGIANPITWPPAYTNQNASVLPNSPQAQETNPATIDQVGYPSIGIFFEGRYYLSGAIQSSTRLYASKIGTTDFSDNAAAGIDVAFFFNLFSNSPVTGLEILSNQYLVIFCRNEIFLLAGIYAPRVGAPEPIITIKPHDQEIGCIGTKAYAKGNKNDIYFLASNRSVYSLQSTDNFQQAKPLGLSELIYPKLEAYFTATLSRSIMVHDRLKGEIQLWLPKDNDKFYPNERLIYSYAETTQEPEWSLDKGINLDVVSAFYDQQSLGVLIGATSGIYRSDFGTTYNGANIPFTYRLAPLDFGRRDIKKKIHTVTIYYRLFSDEAVTLSFESAFDDKASSIETVTLEPKTEAIYGQSNYGQSVYGSNAGEPILQQSFQIADSIGEVLKCVIQSSSQVKFFISEIIFRYEALGAVSK